MSAMVRGDDCVWLLWSGPRSDVRVQLTGTFSIVSKLRVPSVLISALPVAYMRLKYNKAVHL